MLLRCLLSLFAVACLMSAPFGTVFAAEETKDSAKDVQEGSEMPVDPVAKEKADALTQRVVNLAKTLDNDQARHFFVMYSNYTLVSTVKAVEKDVRNAVEACGKNNKSMKNELDAKFATWKNAIAEPMKESMAGINNMIVAQNYTTREEIEAIFKMVEETRHYNSSRFEKIPVTTEEACEFMMTKMEETQANMVGMLKTTLISYPAALQRSQK